MNHLQVISGWLQLGRSERAHQYLEALASHMADEAEVVRKVPPQTGLAILSLGLEAETYGIALQWRLCGPAVRLAEPALGELCGSVQDALRRLSRLPETHRQLTVQLGPGAAFTLHTSDLSGEG